MRAVIQRVARASVRVDSETVGEIGKGLLVLVGVRVGDDEKAADYIVEKIATLRIFADAADKMNLSVEDIRGEVLVVSQFTLYGDVRKGRRPSFIDAARPEEAVPLYEYVLAFAPRAWSHGAMRHLRRHDGRGVNQRRPGDDFDR